MTRLCSSCRSAEARPGQWYCRPCHAEKGRAHRQKRRAQRLPRIPRETGGLSMADLVDRHANNHPQAFVEVGG